MAGGATFKAALSAVKFGPWVAIGTLIGGMIISGVSALLKWQLKKVSEEFQEAASKFSAMKGSDIDAARLDELSNGVDKLGRNISLTEEEYQEFLELNSSLAEIYPELINSVDKAGQCFVGLGE